MMRSPNATTATYSSLAAELSALACQLESRCRPPAEVDAGDAGEAPAMAPSAAIATLTNPTVADATVANSSESFGPLDRLANAFGLSPFERSVVLAAAGLELDGHFAALLSRLAGGPEPQLTYGFALTYLPGAHVSALAPSSPLSRFNIIQRGPGARVLARPLAIAEPVLYALLGVEAWDEAVERLARTISPPPSLVPSQQQYAATLAALWRDSSQQMANAGVDIAVPLLCGADAQARRSIAASASAALGLRLSAIDVEDLPVTADERQQLARFWVRDAALHGAVMFVDLGGGSHPAAARFVDQLAGLIAVGSDSPPLGAWAERRLQRIDLRPPNRAERSELWRRALLANGHDAPSLDNAVDGSGYADAIARVVDQFHLSPGEIHSAAAALNTQHTTQRTLQSPAAALWKTCRTQARPRLDGLAERISSAANWADLVLPDATLSGLRAISTHLRKRNQVYRAWGYAERSARGLGLTALLAGPSGTGKTLAAEVMANDLELDLYRIDLSGVVSKYIGETEKNLKQVFDHAEVSGAVLLFDEADALFGKRSEVRDSHDRHANVEVSYLLQRMESYRGLAILTTNMRSAMDEAFLRRIRFVVDFSFPDAVQRAGMWRRAFTAQTPIADLDVERLAQLQLAGGHIRNVALNAVFLAAEQEQAVTMDHILAAARAEFIKLERPFVVPRARPEQRAVQDRGRA